MLLTCSGTGCTSDSDVMFNNTKVNYSNAFVGAVTGTSSFLAATKDSATPLTTSCCAATTQGTWTATWANVTP